MVQPKTQNEQTKRAIKVIEYLKKNKQVKNYRRVGILLEYDNPGPSMYAIINQGGNLPPEKIQILCEAFKVNPAYILSGAEPMFLESREETLLQNAETVLKEAKETPESYIKGDKLRILPIVLKNENEENITFVPIKAAAGYSSKYIDPQFIRSLPMGWLPFLSKSKTWRGFEVIGNSMDDKYQSGNWVFCSYVADFSAIKSGDTYVIVALNRRPLIKDVENLIETEHRIVLNSFNDTDPDSVTNLSIPINEVKEVWKVEYKLGEPETNTVMERLAAIEFQLKQIKK